MTQEVPYGMCQWGEPWGTQEQVGEKLSQLMVGWGSESEQVKKRCWMWDLREREDWGRWRGAVQSTPSLWSSSQHHLTYSVLQVVFVKTTTSSCLSILSINYKSSSVAKTFQNVPLLGEVPFLWEYFPKYVFLEVISSFHSLVITEERQVYPYLVFVSRCGLWISCHDVHIDTFELRGDFPVPQ